MSVALLRSTKLYSLVTPSPWIFERLSVSFASGASSKPQRSSPSSEACTLSLATSLSRLAAFDKMPQLYDSASFDWGGVSSEHHLAAYWKLDLQQHAAIYQQLADKLGPNHPMAKLIQKELAKEVGEPASKVPRASAAATSFWKAAAKSFQQSFGRSGTACRETYTRPRRRNSLARQCFNGSLLNRGSVQDALMAALPACRVVKATFRCI